MTPDGVLREAVPEERLERARSFMAGFAEATGLSSDRPHRRYLWTDAFAVCNYLGFYERSEREEDLALALTLVDQVHETLGRHREDDSRSGWISGLDEEEGRARPTAGGLRIGKPLPERPPGEPLVERREWSRDGQYFHYLTRWMHALRRVAEITDEMRYHDWAVDLARVAVRRFAVRSGSGARLVWKMSIDLSRPLVPSTGQHDALDGYVTLAGLGEGASDLDSEIRLLAEMVHTHMGSWATGDALGAGGLLVDTLECARLVVEGGLRESSLFDELLEDAAASVETVAGSSFLQRPADARLAFRELGLSIGLAAVDELEHLTEGVKRLGDHRRLRAEIIEFWLDRSHRTADTWTEHQDISTVMMATALAPRGFLGA